VIPINEIRITGFREGKSPEMEYKLPERPLLPGNAPEQAAAATGTLPLTAPRARLN